jgi:hypothetical protein
MGTFTVSLREMIDMDEPIFLSDEANKYPIFDEDYRPLLNRKIIDHYMMYEIGHETMGQFRFALNRKMREIMPYYNQLYKTVQNEIDPFKTMDYSDDSISHQTGEATSTSTGTSESDTDSKSRAVSSDTPQTQLSGNEDYASSMADSAGTTNVNGSSTSDASQSNTGDGTLSRSVTGSQGHQATLMMQYRKSLLNIDMNVISELESLFMALWDNGDEFHTTSLRGGYPYGFGWFGSL